MLNDCLGLDTDLIIAPLREYGGKQKRILSGLPQEPAITSAPSARLLVSWWAREVSIWHVQRPFAMDDDSAGDELGDLNNRRLVAKINLKVSFTLSIQ